MRYFMVLKKGISSSRFFNFWATMTRRILMAVIGVSLMLATGPDESAETATAMGVGVTGVRAVGASTTSPEGVSTSSSYW